MNTNIDIRIMDQDGKSTMFTVSNENGIGPKEISILRFIIEQISKESRDIVTNSIPQSNKPLSTGEGTKTDDTIQISSDKTVNSRRQR